MATRKKRGKGGRAWFGTALGVGLMTAVALFAVASYFGYRFYQEAFPNVAILKTRYPHVIARGEKEPPLIRIEKARPPSWTPLLSISPMAVGAIVVSEDWAFYQHKGYDPVQIRDAIEQSLSEGHFVRGASTITQQVAKNVFLSRDKTLWRKGRELVLSLRLERDIGKKKILEIYLNVAEWGPQIYGIGPASEYYFHKTPSELNAREGAFLALLLPSPIRYGQSFRKHQLTAFASHTLRAILDKMVQAGFLTAEDAATMKSSSLSFEERPPEGGSPEDSENLDEADPENNATQQESPAPEVLFDEPDNSGT